MKKTTIAIIRQMLKDEVRESLNYLRELEDQIEKEMEDCGNFKYLCQRKIEIHGWYISYKEALEDFKKEFPYED